MGAIAYGLSVTHFVNSVGAKAGFAAIIAVALLVLLFFAQMRETASLRDRAAASDEHVQELELRVAQLSRGLAAQTSSGPAVVPAPAGLSRSAPASAAVAAAAAGTVASRTVRPPSAPAGVGAPALSSATRLIPSGDEEPISIRAAGAGVAAPVAAGVAAAAVGGGVGSGDGASGDGGSGDGGSGGGGSAGSIAAPPGPRPATAAGGANGGPADRPPAPVPAPAPPPPSARPPQQRPPQQRPPARNGAPRQPVMTTYSAGPSAASRIRAGLMIAAGIAVVAIVVILLLHATSGGTSSTSSTVADTNHHSHHGGRAVPLKPADVSVTVLNGTETTNLAHDITQHLAGFGYKTGTPATATDHTLGSTVVGYRGRSNRAAALLVARSLKLGPASVQPVGQSNLAVACPQTSACTAQVIVTVGADLASAAGTATTAASTT